MTIRPATGADALEIARVHVKSWRTTYRGRHRTMLLWVLAANSAARRFYESLGGRAVREQMTDIGGTPYPEIGYGWDDLAALVRRLSGAAGSPPDSAGTAG